MMELRGPPGSNLFQVTRIESGELSFSLPCDVTLEEGGEFALAPGPAPRVMPTTWELNK